MNKIAFDSMIKELKKEAIGVMPIVMGGLYGAETLGKVKESVKKTNPVNAVGNTTENKNYPEY
jgi:hypothetical protein